MMTKSDRILYLDGKGAESRTLAESEELETLLDERRSVIITPDVIRSARKYAEIAERAALTTCEDYLSEDDLERAWLAGYTAYAMTVRENP